MTSLDKKKFKEIMMKVGRGELEITNSRIVGDEIWFKVKKTSKSDPDYNCCRRCKHKGICEGYGELIRCVYNYPDKKFEEVVE